MAEQENKPRVPTALKRLVNNYLNTCVFMARMWRRLAALLAVAFPLAFILREGSLVQALVNAVGFWLIAAVVSRLAVLEFRILRAGWVARTIDRRIPAGHTSRDVVIEWIRDKNDGNFLNSLLTKLGVAPQPPVAQTAPNDPTAFINGILSKLGKQGQQSLETYVYGNTITQVLNDNGEWVTIQESQPAAPEGPPPEESVQQALEELAPPENFKPIPIAAPGGKDKKKSKRKKKRRRRAEHMLLEPEAYEPEPAGERRESG